MKYLLLQSIIISLMTSCCYNSQDEIKYEIYSSVLDKKFGHFAADTSYVIGIDDTIKDFKNELGTLIYSVKSNYLFFKEYGLGDTSFKHFILGVKTLKTDKEVMDIEKLKSKTKIKISFDKFIKPGPSHHTIYFSKIVLNKTTDKAILFIVGTSSGSCLLVELINKRWTVKHEILSWVV